MSVRSECPLRQRARSSETPSSNRPRVGRHRSPSSSSDAPRSRTVVCVPCSRISGSIRLWFAARKSGHTRGSTLRRSASAPDLALSYREAAGSDIFVLIIGGRYGSERSDSRTTNSHTFFERYNSITKGEYQSALDNDVPIYILVEAQVHTEYSTFLRNKGNPDVQYAHVDSVNIFALIEEILSLRRNNAFNTFANILR